MHKGENMDGLINVGREPPAQPAANAKAIRPIARTDPPNAEQPDVDRKTSAATREADPDPREQALERLKSVLADVADQLPPNAKLVIRRDEESRRFVYEFTDPVTGEVTRQFPTEEVLAVMRAAKQSTSGVILDSKA